MSDDPQTIFRVHREERDRWTPIINETLRDPRLSFKATGIIGYLLSLPGDWEVNQTHLSKVKTDGKDSVSAGFKELSEFGYISKEYVRDKGRIVKTIWHVYERPRTTPKPEKPETVSPKPEKPLSVFPKAENPPQRKTEGNEGMKGTNEPKGVGSASLGANGEEEIAPSNETAIRLAKCIGRQSTTAWSPKEIKAFKVLMKSGVDEQDLVAVEVYYLANRKLERNICRRDLLTLLNNFPGEVDRAKAWIDSQPNRRGGSRKPQEEEREGI